MIKIFPGWQRILCKNKRHFQQVFFFQHLPPQGFEAACHKSLKINIFAIKSPILIGQNKDKFP
jgi:hypothetical protein